MNSSIRLNDDYSERVQYNNPDYPIYIRRGLLSGYPEYRAPDHWHDDIEFLCVLSGRMKYNVNEDITELEEGDGIFVNAGQMHFGVIFSVSCFIRYFSLLFRHMRMIL